MQEKEAQSIVRGIPSHRERKYNPFIKRAANYILRKCGIYVSFKSPDDLTEHLRQLFSMLDINCVIDVGAHEGYFGRDLRRFAGYRGRIASFEPASSAYKNLERRAAQDPEWRIANCGLGAVSGEKVINLTRFTTCSSLLTPSKLAADEFGEGMDVLSREQVTIRTLDEMFDWCVDGIPQPRVYLKLDTQGYDMEVLRGAQGTIGRVLAMQSEVSVQSLYDSVPGMAEATKYFESLGFRVTGFFVVNRAKDLSVLEVDCVLRR
ncbi:MAG: FkbM family methyltransferase [Methylocapsa sp.]|nr:FkbM family methyltransferase [Methylocapsa sp.]